MSNSKYQAFITTAKVGSLSRAATIMGYTQSGISHLIHALENELGLPLLIRSRNGAKLTAEGKTLLPYVQSLLAADEAIQNVVQEIKGLQVGSLRIGSFSSITLHFLPSLLSLFNTRYPGIELNVVNGSYSYLETALLEDSLDCAFLTIPTLDEFNVHALCEDRLMVILPQGHPLSLKSELVVTDLLCEPFVMPAEGSNYDIGKLFQSNGVIPNVRFTMEDDFSAVEMVRHNMGITVLAEILISAMPQNGIVAVPLRNTVRKIGIATKRNRSLSPSVRVFTEVVKETVRL